MLPQLRPGPETYSHRPQGEMWRELRLVLPGGSEATKRLPCSDKYNVESEYYTSLVCHSVGSGQASDFALKEAIELCS